MESTAQCCPRFNPESWENRELTWQDKLFVKDRVFCVCHIPLNMGTVIPRMYEKVKEAGAETSEMFILSYDPSPWVSEQYMSVGKAVPGMELVKLSGAFLCKVFEGPYQEAKQWYQDMLNYARSKEKTPGKVYFYYTTCPKCAEAYGKNYVVGVVQVD